MGYIFAEWFLKEDEIVAHFDAEIKASEAQILRSDKSMARLIRLQRSPLTLALVCKLWNRAAMNTPGLWSHLYANFAASKAMSDAELATMYVFLKRSQATPLTIFIRMDIEGTYLPPDLAPILASCSTRWQSVRLDDAPVSIVNETPLLEGPFPALHSFTIRHFNNDPDLSKSLNLAKLQSIAGAHRLRSFQMDSWEVDFNELRLPWSQLTTMELRDLPDSAHAFTLPVALDIISQCPQLEELSISLSMLGDSPTRPLLTASKLERLFVFPETSHVVQLLLDQLRLPSLRELTVHSSYRQGVECSMDSVERLVQRSACILTSLSLNQLIVPPATLLSLFARTGYLTEL